MVGCCTEHDHFGWKTWISDQSYILSIRIEYVIVLQDTTRYCKGVEDKLDRSYNSYVDTTVSGYFPNQSSINHTIS